jgi:hypothetical protein
MNPYLKSIGLLLFTFVLLFQTPGLGLAAAAASVASFQPTFEKLAADADATGKVTLLTQYGELATLESDITKQTAEVKKKQYANEERLKAIKQKIKQIDAAKLERLKKETEQVRKKYQPLFESYKSLNNQADTASSLGAKKLATGLRKQASLLKLPQQLARLDIKNKDAALKTAKSKAAEAGKKVKDTLAKIDSLKIKLKASRSTAAAHKSSYSPVWTSFRSAVKKKELKSAKAGLPSLISLSRKQLEQLQQQAKLEDEINTILASAEKLLP